MNAPTVSTSVSKTVRTRLGRTLVAVGPATGLELMAQAAVVRACACIIVCGPFTNVIHCCLSFTPMHADINECTTGTHQCAHNCQNTIGSYTCSCRTGYRLASNGRSCYGRYRLHTCMFYLVVHDTMDSNAFPSQTP